MRTLKHAAVSALALFGVETASAASFPCEKATTAVEKSICADKAVSELDEHLGRYYSAARAALGTGKSCLAQDQKAWLKTRNACKDAKCLKRVYLGRLAMLDALQPGMTAVKNIDLPRVDTLMWIIPARGRHRRGAARCPLLRPRSWSGVKSSMTSKPATVS